jgi:hypothetical protein
MRAIDYFLRVLTAITAIGLIILSDTISWKLLCFSFFSVGLWAVLFPPGVLGWAKGAHRDFDPTDPSLWWLARLIGTAFIVFALVMTIAFFKR